MRTELQAKFIQHLNNRKNSEKGFTLVELLVVIIIIGILAAIALPNFLSQGAKAKQTEAKQNVGLVNRVQTAYRSENAGFASSFNILATGTLTGDDSFSTTSYSYSLSGGTDTTSLIALSQDSALKGYSGGTVRYVNDSSQSVVSSVVCEALTPDSSTSAAPDLDETASIASNAIACTTSYKAL
jgi:type IV pilus assembly protein PilA